MFDEQITSVFANMLTSATSPFNSRLPVGATPANHVYHVSTFKDILDEEATRPLALIDANAGASRNTEGDLDLPLGSTRIRLLIEIHASEFSYGNDQSALKEFRAWHDDIKRWLLQYPTNLSEYLRFANMTTEKSPDRTPSIERATADDIFCAVTAWQVETGGGE